MDEVFLPHRGRLQCFTARFVLEGNEGLIHLVEGGVGADGRLQYRWICGSWCTKSAFRTTNERVNCLDCMAKAP